MDNEGRVRDLHRSLDRAAKMDRLRERLDRAERTGSYLSTLNDEELRMIVCALSTEAHLLRLHVAEQTGEDTR